MTCSPLGLRFPAIFRHSGRSYEFGRGKPRLLAQREFLGYSLDTNCRSVAKELECAPVRHLDPADSGGLNLIVRYHSSRSEAQGYALGVNAARGARAGSVLDLIELSWEPSGNGSFSLALCPPIPGRRGDLLIYSAMVPIAKPLDPQFNEDMWLYGIDSSGNDMESDEVERQLLSEDEFGDGEDVDTNFAPGEEPDNL